MGKFFGRKISSISSILLAVFFSSTPGIAQEIAPETFTDCDICPEMVVVPAGEVMLGTFETEAYATKRDRPKQKAVIERPFAIGKYEVTLAQFRKFMEETNHQQTVMTYKGKAYEGCNYFDGKGYGYVKMHNWNNVGFAQREDQPVVCVSWSDANAFAGWISEKAGRQYRVPSSVEFEYALRAGSETPWTWGTDPSKACEYANIADETFVHDYPKRPSFNCHDGYKFMASVGKFKPNDFGLYDMLGNAWEWSNDCWHDDMTDAPLDGSSWGSEDGGDCTVRTPKGGGWISGPAWSRSPVRSADGQHYRSFMLGFRLATDIL